jgi:hypothetical protein
VPTADEEADHRLPTAVDRVQDPEEAGEDKGGASSDPQAHLSTTSPSDAGHDHHR